LIHISQTATTGDGYMPLDPGTTLHIVMTRNGIFTEEGYGFGVEINKYGVKA